MAYAFLHLAMYACYFFAACLLLLYVGARAAAVKSKTPPTYWLRRGLFESRPDKLIKIHSCDTEWGQWLRQRHTWWAHNHNDNVYKVIYRTEVADGWEVYTRFYNRTQRDHSPNAWLFETRYKNTRRGEDLGYKWAGTVNGMYENHATAVLDVFRAVADPAYYTDNDSYVSFQTLISSLAGDLGGDFANSVRAGCIDVSAAQLIPRHMRKHQKATYTTQHTAVVRRAIHGRAESQAGAPITNHSGSIRNLVRRPADGVAPTVYDYVSGEPAHLAVDLASSPDIVGAIIRNPQGNPAGITTNTVLTEEQARAMIAAVGQAHGREYGVAATPDKGLDALPVEPRVKRRMDLE